MELGLGTVLSVAKTCYKTIQSPEFQELWSSISSYREHIESLQTTVEIVEAVFKDAESVELQLQERLPYQARIYLDQLKEVVFDADDLLDEFAYLAEQEKLIKQGNIVFQKLRAFLLRTKSLPTARKLSLGVKEISAKFDSITNSHSKFCLLLSLGVYSNPSLSAVQNHPRLGLGPQPSMRKMEETSSFVDAQGVIGRDEDLNDIVAKLLDANVQQNLSCLTIVGIGGVGKTTLAQLVLKDARIENQFPVRQWVCVADENSHRLNVKATLLKILGAKSHENLSMEEIQNKIGEKLGGKKYLLALDDVWSEDAFGWRELSKFLMVGLKGSWIIVTTRSQGTARVVGGHTNKLEGLSDAYSWSLFKRLAFGQEDEQTIDAELVRIGKSIVSQCANVPLAIKVAGTLLCSQDKKEWVKIQELGLQNNDIMPILKISYHRLESPLKTCFSYCALFPKDYEITKSLLISQWMAQGYVVPLYECQTLEDAGEEYFEMLLNRCFFQEAEKDIYGEIISCKIHDLMHDIALQVAGKEIYSGDSIPRNSGNKIRHVSYVGKDRFAGSLSCSAKIRTFLQVDYGRVEGVGALLAKWRCLRVLDLSRSSIESERTISSLGELLHLRYLDLSWSLSMKTLPESITKLHHLQTLLLRDCWNLKKLPSDLSKLSKLRTLDTRGCDGLARMPRGLEKLNSLKTLPLFVINARTWGKFVDQLKGLIALTNLQGKLKLLIRTPEDAHYDKKQQVSLQGLLSQHLNRITIDFRRYGPDKDVNNGHFDETLLDDLRPRMNLGRLRLKDYNGERMPSWAMSLQEIVTIHLEFCHSLQHLTGLGKLPKLKSLTLYSLPALEYIENKSMYSGGVQVSGYKESSIFISLETLVLHHLDKLKGWWGDDSDGNTNQEHDRPLPLFPSLSTLKISSCRGLQHLRGIGRLPELKSLKLHGLPSLKYVDDKAMSCNCSSTTAEGASESEESLVLPSLEKLELTKLPEFKGWWKLEENVSNQEHNLLWPSFPRVSTLRIKNCRNLQHLTGIGKLPELKSLALTNLSELVYMEDTTMSSNSKRVGASESSILPALKELTLWDMPKFKGWWKLEENVSNQEHYLLWPSFPRLSTLEIGNCRNLQHLTGIGKLPKLKSLLLDGLSELVVYVEDTTMSSNSKGVGASESSILRALEELRLRNMPRLIGWWRTENTTNEEDHVLPPSFPNLTTLDIRNCPLFVSIPLCPGVKDLYLHKFNGSLQIVKTTKGSGNPNLGIVTTSNARYLKYGLPAEALRCLREMTIEEDEEIESLSEVKEVLRHCSSSLRKLRLNRCCKLKSVSGGLEHLTALEELMLEELHDLNLSNRAERDGEEEEEDGMPWHHLRHCLRSLKLTSLPQMTNLPKWILNLTALRSLQIESCEAQESVPEWMQQLTSLQTLRIGGCSQRLRERCREDTGKDWPNIQHIPQRQIWS